MWHAIADRGMRNSGLTDVLDRKSYTRDRDLFQKQVLHVVRSM
jgi:hypothetical protein